MLSFDVIFFPIEQEVEAQRVIAESKEKVKELEKEVQCTCIHTFTQHMWWALIFSTLDC